MKKFHISWQSLLIGIVWFAVTTFYFLSEWNIIRKYNSSQNYFMGLRSVWIYGRNYSPMDTQPYLYYWKHKTSESG